MSGISVVQAMRYMAVAGLEKACQGGLPVTISSTVQPTDQMSAFFQLCVCARARTPTQGSHACVLACRRDGGGDGDEAATEHSGRRAMVVAEKCGDAHMR